MKRKEQSECVYRGFHMVCIWSIEVFSTTNSGSEGIKGRREPWVGFDGAFRELSDDRSIFVQ